jgi:hypothetical protein
MDLTRFDRQDEFTSLEIACLLCGLDPVEAVKKETISNDLNLIKSAMLNAFRVYRNQESFTENSKLVDICLLPVILEEIIGTKFSRPTISNVSGKENPFKNLANPLNNDCNYLHAINDSDLFCLDDEYYDYFSSAGFDDDKFLRTKFSRVEVCRWLKACGHVSTFGFSIDESVDVAKEDVGGDLKQSNNAIENHIDPEDLPDELDIANIAYSAVMNGHGDESLSFKQKLTLWLNEMYPKLSKEATNRIATVANKDKRPGRR